jgi:hypothetical protein
MRQTGIGLDFAGLREGGTVPYGGEPIVQFPGGVVPTPSGCVEIASARAGADGLPFAHADPRPGDDMLRLLSPASPWLLNDSFPNDAKVTERIGSAKVGALHPLDAADRGLAAGDPVVLSNADRPARAGARAVRASPARRRAVTQGPLAQARGDQRQRERAQPRDEVRHGGCHVGPRRRGAGEPRGLAAADRLDDAAAATAHGARPAVDLAAATASLAEVLARRRAVGRCLVAGNHLVGHGERVTRRPRRTSAGPTAIVTDPTRSGGIRG